LLPDEALCSGHSSTGSRSGLPCLVSTPPCGLEPKASHSPQAGSVGSVCFWIAVRSNAANRTSNVLIGVLRVNSLTGMVYPGDEICGIETTLMWAIAQISTGNCCSVQSTSPPPLRDDSAARTHSPEQPQIQDHVQHLADVAEATNYTGPSCSTRPGAAR